MIELHEVLTFKEFFEKVNEEINCLRRQYMITGDEIYKEKINDIIRIRSDVIKLRDYVVPVKTYDNTLGYVHFESKEDRDSYYHYAMHERDMNFR